MLYSCCTNSSFAGFKFWKQHARKLYAVNRNDINPPDPPSPLPKKRKTGAELTLHELDTILHTLEEVEEKVSDKLESIFRVTKNDMIPLGLKTSIKRILPKVYHFTGHGSHMLWPIDWLPFLYRHLVHYKCRHYEADLPSLQSHKRSRQVMPTER